MFDNISTASISATNTSMNAEGDIFKQATSISKETYKATTSDEALKSYAIAGGTALLTAGLTQGINAIANSTANSTNNVANATSNTANTINNTNTTLTAGSTINTASSNYSSLITQKFTNALKNSAIQSISSSAAQSAVSGDSFSESLKNSLQNIAINAIGEVGANQIGSLAHPTDQFGNNLTPQISKAQQLALHAALGATSSALSGNDILSGAISGIVGEQATEYLSKNTSLTRTQIIESSKLIGALTSAAIVGPDDGDSVFSGSQIARNAGENNYLMPKEKMSLVKELKSCNGNSTCENKVQKKYEKISDPRDKEFTKAYASCEKNGKCDALKSIHYDLRGELTKEGNEYFWKHIGEFELLPEYKSVYHTFVQDPKTKEVLSGQNYNMKYVHPILGYEVVIGHDGKIVTDSLNGGTYNFYNPNMGAGNNLLEDKYSGIIGGALGNHKRYDIKPYELLGNNHDDPTSEDQRGLINGINRAFQQQIKKFSEK